MWGGRNSAQIGNNNASWISLPQPSACLCVLRYALNNSELESGYSAKCGCNEFGIISECGRLSLIVRQTISSGPRCRPPIVKLAGVTECFGSWA